MMKKKGLSLCGGGSLGAYEMGVWKYLREIGEDDFDVITGASIGSIVGAFWTRGAYDEGMKLWSDGDVKSVMHNGIDFDEEFKLNEDFIKFAKTYFKGAGADATPILKTLYDTMPQLKLTQLAPKKFGIIVCTYPGMKELKIDMSTIEEDHVVDYIMASSSCWPVFPFYTIEGKRYVDGGWKNNLPIDFALELGATEVTAVLLNSVPVAQKQEYFRLPNVRLIRPSWEQGSMLSFKREKVDENLALGYLDAKKAYGHALGNAYAFIDNGTLASLAEEFLLISLRLSGEKVPAQWDYLYKKDIHGANFTTENYFIFALEQLMRLYDIEHLKEWDALDALKAVKDAILSYQAPEKGADKEKNGYLSLLRDNKGHGFRQDIQNGTDLALITLIVSRLSD